MLKCAFLLLLAFSLSSCIVNRAVDYSFNAPNHEDFFIADHCFAIDDWPGDRLLLLLVLLNLRRQWLNHIVTQRSIILLRVNYLVPCGEQKTVGIGIWDFLPL